MVAITFFSIESEENVPCSEMSISIDSVQRSRFWPTIEVLSIFHYQKFHFKTFFDRAQSVLARKPLKFVFNKPYRFKYAFLLSNFCPTIKLIKKQTLLWMDVFNQGIPIVGSEFSECIQNGITDPVNATDSLLT